MRYTAAFSAILGLLSVIIGAAGDHAGGIAQQHAFDTALRYHQLYSIVLLALGLHILNVRENAGKMLKAATAFMLAGTAVFCTTLYALAYTGHAVLGYITPLGGVLLMAGWMMLAIYALRAARLASRLSL